MQTTTPLYYLRHEPMRPNDQGTPREDERNLVLVPTQSSVERYYVNPPPEIYRQALQSLLTTPDIENRLNSDDIAASFVFVLLGSWLTRKLVRTRAFIFFADLLIVVTSLALAGLLIGVMIGENILPIETIPVLLFAATGIVLVIMTLGLGGMIVSASQPSKRPTYTTSSQQGIVVARTRRYPITHSSKTIEGNRV